jgi:ubiquinone/menaquinone biosynthesis C-methylase UbiE
MDCDDPAAMATDGFNEDDGRYFSELAAAFARGKLGLPLSWADAEAIRVGLERGLRLHKFKRQAELPRVRKVIGALQGIGPSSLLDVGTGRGTFLWPLLDAFPFLEVVSMDVNPIRVADIACVRRGGVGNLRGLRADAMAIGLADRCVDVVTVLEVIEHLPDPQRAAREAVRIARNFVIASVPSKEDDNPEHIQLFDKASFGRLWLEAGASGVKIEYVLNHMIAMAKV